MNHSKLMSSLFALCLLTITCGCGEQKTTPATVTGNPTPKATSTTAENPAAINSKAVVQVQEANDASTKSVGTKLEPTPTDSSKEDIQAPPAKTENRQKAPAKKPVMAATDKPAREKRPFDEARLLPQDTIGILVAHPIQFLESPIGKMLTEVGVENVSVRQTDIIPRAMQLHYPELERITVAIQQSLVNEIAAKAGLQPPRGDNAAAGQPVQNPELRRIIDVRNSLKQIGLAFHNCHDVYGAFPRAGGDAAGETTGLSWRVHLLPFLDQAELYEKFNLDEPWDSENNKPLISEMPAVFRSQGTKEDGKTLFHVFTGEGTPFNGDQATAMRSFLDGTSNTILVVQAAPDKAEVWTKPGGLEVDLTMAKKSLGDFEEEKFFALFTDGSVHQLPVTIDETMLACLIQPADGNAVEIDDQPMNESPSPIPLFIFTYAKPANQGDIVKGLFTQATEETVEGQKIYSSPQASAWFSDPRTVVIGSADSVKKLIADKGTDRSELQPLVAELQLNADFTAAIDVQSQSDLLKQLSQFNQMIGMFTNIATVSFHASAHGNEGESLVELNVFALDAGMAGGLSAIMNLALNQAQGAANQIPEQPGAADNEKELQNFFKQMIASATVDVADERIQFRVPISQDFDRLPELLKPTILNAKQAAGQMQLMNGMKMMGLAFHSFHDVYSTFPGAGRLNEDKPIGLSWRVHILPFLDQAPLYNQFKFDEPWDSDHNKTLIDKMPDIFKSPGVEDVGKTAYHVFTGPNAPFAGDQAPGIVRFVDGTSNTILVVLAGADTADVWTKPGGLDFDRDDPIQALGKLIGQRFLVLMADGSVRFEEKTIDPANLRRMIQINDGEPLQ